MYYDCQFHLCLFNALLEKNHLVKSNVFSVNITTIMEGMNFLYLSHMTEINELSFHTAPNGM